MKVIFFLCLFAVTALFAGSIRIMNDSPFQLKAEIIASDGSHKGILSINPQQQMTWQDSLSGANVWSQTPYVIIFTCKNGKQFGVLNGVQQGATVTALSSIGDRYCQPDKKRESDKNSKNEQQTTPFIPSHPFEKPSDSAVGPADPTRSPDDPIWGPP